MALEWQKVEVPLREGLDTKTNAQALPASKMALLQNCQFDIHGGIQQRLPFSSLATDIFGGGTVSDLRRLAVFDDELLLFTKDKLYSWSIGDSEWVEIATHLAPAMSEASTLVRTSEQTLADRAALGSVVLYTWYDDGVATGTYVAALDSATGAMLVEPTQISGTNVTRPKLVAVTNVILMFAIVNGDLSVRKIDPTTVASDIASATWTTIEAAANFNTYYDAVKQSSSAAAVVYRRTPTTSYTIASIDEDATAAKTTKARTCDGPIAVAVSAGTDVAVIRGNGTAVQGDVLDSSYADVNVGVAVGTAAGTPINQIAAEFSTVQVSSEYVCSIWYSAVESAGASSAFECRYATLNTAGSATDSLFLYNLGVATRAFAHDGDVFVWLVFAKSSTSTATQLQSTFFLYRDDGHWVSKAAPNVAGGYVPETGHLPGVQGSGDTYTAALVERRLIDVGSQAKDYAQRSPREVSVTFDSDAARRVARLGKTLYVAGGQVQQYDGRSLVELGFPIAPYRISVVDSGVSGALAAGTYSWRDGLRWENARGELERSTSTTFFDAAIAASRKASIAAGPVHPTSKSDTGNECAYELWRTTVDTDVTAQQYLVTSKDPTATGDNGYLENDTSLAVFSTQTDNFNDTTLQTKEPHPENDGRLEFLAPPSCTIIASDRTRLFLAGIANAPYKVVYSQQRLTGEMASFNDFLSVNVPEKAGVITALAFLNDTLVVFTETGIFVLAGEGFGNTGAGSNYGPAQTISDDVGAVNAESVATTPVGLVFKSAKGWYLLDRSWSVRYIGAPVTQFDAETVAAVQVLEDCHQIRCLLSSARMLVFEYLVEQWAEWTVSDGRHAVLWNGTHAVVTSSVVRTQQTDFTRTANTETAYNQDAELGWLQLDGVHGFQRIRRVHILGEYRGAHNLRIRLAEDHGTTFFQMTDWAVSPTTVGGAEAVVVRPARQKSRALKLRISSIATNASTPGSNGTVGATLSDDAPDGEGFRLTGVAFEIGIKRPGYRQYPTGQKA